MNLISLPTLTKDGQPVSQTALFCTNRFNQYNDNGSSTTKIDYVTRKWAGAPTRSAWTVNSSYTLVSAAAAFSRPGINISLPVLYVDSIPVNATQSFAVDNIVNVYTDPTNPSQSIIVYDAAQHTSPQNIVVSITPAAVSVLANKAVVNEGVVPSLTTTQRTALAAAAGQIVHDVTDGFFYGWDGSSWVQF